MKKTFKLIIATLLLTTGVFAQNEMVLEGTYQGENLYVMNPFASSGVGFCIIGVTVNGQTSIDEINQSAFEIDFASYQLKKGEAVTIKIEYKDDCSPRVLNPDVLKATSTYVIVTKSVSKDGLISWTTTGESGSLPYIIEQKRWNKWIKIGEVKGKGTAGNNSYTFQAKPHSGKNTFRIKQVDYSKNPRISAEFRLVRSDVPEVVIANPDINKIEGSIIFKTVDGADAETFYEIWSMHGTIVKKGYGSQVDISSLERGTYFVNFDATTVAITKI